MQLSVSDTLCMLTYDDMLDAEQAGADQQGAMDTLCICSYEEDEDTEQQSAMHTWQAAKS